MTTPASTKLRRGKWRKRILILYLALLVVTHIIRATQADDEGLSNGETAITVQAVDGLSRTNKPVRLAYREYLPEGSNEPATIVLLHGSPGSKEDFRALVPQLARRYRVIVPDLPGFGHSSHAIPDYSIRAHADYVLQLLDQLQIKRVHVVGFSMGGGVALNLIDRAPERVASLVMLSSIGVQEMELLGNYYMNHALHGLLLAGMWTLEHGIPDMGLNRHSFGMSFARNFFDSDQRPLRDILTRVASPTLIIHGTNDPLVPYAAAIEHHRLIPQSELRTFDDNHFMPFTKGPMLAGVINEFLARVEQGQTQTRATADAARLTEAAAPFDPSHLPKAVGITALVFLCLIALSTFVSEDLTCIGAGVMVAQGRIGFMLGATACFLGIFVGDVLLYFAGRFLGRAALKRAPLKWFIRAADVEKSSAWFSRRGIPVILASRFVPGSRLPTYFAAGLLDTKFWWFALYFLIAGAVWSPLLVGLARALGAEVIESSLLAGQNWALKIIAAAVMIYVIAKLIMALSSYRGRRMLVSRWRRLTRWEFWPAWAFYPPVIIYVAYLTIKHRSLTVFTAANPAIPASGFIGESKIDILNGLSGDERIARASLIEAAFAVAARIAAAQQFMQAARLSFPVVLKPNEGQRGSGVLVVRSDAELADYLKRTAFDTIIQEYVAGAEFGVFYYRYPDEARGHIFSITEKRMPVVVGDGTSSLERLILSNERAVCMARFYLQQQGARAWDVPAEGERVQLVELGTHCRGAIFLDGGWAKTDELEQAMEAISRRYAGFYFGRFDVRTPSVEAFTAGREFKVIELNGVTSEATHIYDPKNSLFDAYRVLFAQWRMAFDIGAANRRRGVQPTSLRELLKMLFDYRRRARAHLT